MSRAVIGSHRRWVKMVFDRPKSRRQPTPLSTSRFREMGKRFVLFQATFWRCGTIVDHKHIALPMRICLNSSFSM